MNSPFVGIYDAIDILLSTSGDQGKKNELAKTVLGTGIFLYGASKGFRDKVNDILLDKIDFLAGKFLAGLLFSLAVSLVLLPGAGLLVYMAIAISLQILSTLGYLLNSIRNEL